MKSTLITILVAATVAWTAPVPARAMEAETGTGLIAGLVSLGLIARTADDRQDRERAAAAGLASRNADTFVPIRRGEAVRLGSAQSVPLPGACLVRIDTRGRHGGLAYGSQCLRRNYVFADQLPKACEGKVRTSRGLRKAYDARCLRHEGFRVEARRGN